MAGVSGSIKEAVIGGVTYPVPSDNEPMVIEGGTYPVDTEETSNGPVIVVSNVSGKVKGLVLKVFGKGQATLKNIMDSSRNSVSDPGSVAARIVMADGSAYTFSGGAYVNLPDAVDGAINMHSGEVTVDLIAIGGDLSAE